MRPNAGAEPGMFEIDNRIWTDREFLAIGNGGFAVLRLLGWAILILSLLWQPIGLAAASDSSNSLGYPNFQNALQGQMHAEAEVAKSDDLTPEETSHYSVRVVTAVGICAVLTLLLIIPRVGQLINYARNISVTSLLALRRASLQNARGQKPFVPETATEMVRRAKAKTGKSFEEALDEFFRSAPDQIAVLRNTFGQITHASDRAGRQKVLHSLCADVKALKTRLEGLNLDAASLLASELESLLNQLGEKSTNITPSTLRTAAGALVLLGDLCVRGVRADLASNPPVRILTVDDEPISRRAVTMALKKACPSPDVVENGEAALEIAARQPYDAVFLDVEMPGLDGYEVCTRIHQLQPNRTTPVVFVTSYSDFDSRAKSLSSGGRDLIAKPFLSSELAIKALTLVMRGRLERDKPSQKVEPKDSAPAQSKEPVSATQPKPETSQAAAASKPSKPSNAKAPDDPEAAGKLKANKSSTNKSDTPSPAAAQPNEQPSPAKPEAETPEVSSAAKSAQLPTPPDEPKPANDSQSKNTLTTKSENSNPAAAPGKDQALPVPPNAETSDVSLAAKPAEPTKLPDAPKVVDNPPLKETPSQVDTGGSEPRKGDFCDLSVTATETAAPSPSSGQGPLEQMQQWVSKLSTAMDPNERHEILTELNQELDTLRSKAAGAGLAATCQLASALGKLVAKLLEAPGQFGPSALQAIKDAIESLKKLSACTMEPDLNNPAIRVLVVDDDPIARRAVSNALQLAFDKPDNAETGQAAVALAGQKIFDVIFLDILMPDMDGFETCSKIRRTGLNAPTPVVFVTSQTDAESREKSIEAGGNGFISKPVLPAEIFLTALTFGLRGRMEKSEVPCVDKLLAAMC